jgi:hypothetical protein
VTATTTTTTTPRSLSAPDTPEQRSADRALAKRALLRLADLPLGYKVSKDDATDDDEGDTSADDAAVNRRFADCAQLSPELTKAMLSDDPPPGIVDVQSPGFEHESGLLDEVSVDSSVDVGRTPESVARLLEVFAVVDKKECFEKLFASAGEAGAAEGGGQSRFEAVESAGPIGVGDRSGGFRVTMTISASGITIPFALDVVAAQRGRALASVTVTSIGAPVEKQFARSLLRKVAERLDDAA